MDLGKGALTPRPRQRQARRTAANRNYSWPDYGNRIGIWRLFDLADGLDLPLAHDVNSLLYREAPQILVRVGARGDEIIAHGCTNAENFTDSPQIIHRLHTGREFCDMLVDPFEERVEQSGKYPLVSNVSIHLYTFGYPFRLRPLRRAPLHCFRSKLRERHSQSSRLR